MTSIILNSREVKGILDGSVKMLVRPMKQQPKFATMVEMEHRGGKLVAVPYHRGAHMLWNEEEKEVSPFGDFGTKLWCKETWGYAPASLPSEKIIWYKEVDGNRRRADITRWKSPITMPQWASRLTIETKSVRVVRVHEMSDYDCELAGIKVNPASFSIGALSLQKEYFKTIWQSTYGKKYPYETNPYVFLGEIGRVA